jgi:dTDP-4-dehydrorhamnose reductase
MGNIVPVTLIIGSDSLVGGALMAYLQKAGVPVMGTTRRREAVDKTHPYLDLAHDADAWQYPQPVDVAIICAGVTKREACRQEPARSAEVNVKGAAAIVKNLVAKGTFVIYLSSDQVFDGSVPYRLPDDPYSPVTEYGRQKAEAERQVSRWGDSTAIVRFSKILEPEPPLFIEWVKSLKQGRTIHPFADIPLAPVPLPCAISVLRLMADRRLPGILQVSGERDISYAEAARMGARLLKVNPDLVQPVKACELGRFTEPLPAHTTLNIDRLRSALGIIPPEVRWTVETAFINSTRRLENVRNQFTGPVPAQPASPRGAG